MHAKYTFLSVERSELDRNYAPSVCDWLYSTWCDHVAVEVYKVMWAGRKSVYVASARVWKLYILYLAGWLEYAWMDRVQPDDGWCCLWVWNVSVCIVSVCIVVALRGASNFSHVEYEAGCSLMIISTQMKAEDPLHSRRSSTQPKILYTGTRVNYCGVLCVQSSFFPHTVRFFPPRWCGPTTSK